MKLDSNRHLELILQYNMNEFEAKAFKISCLYLEKANKFFPNYKHYNLPKGDPRKSDLFRHCYKLLREKGDKIADEDFVLYIHAQMDVLRSIKKGDMHPFITPSCISGEKAWRRWLLWKSKYDKLIEARISSKELSPKVSLEKIKKDLWKTKQFFFAWFDRLNPEDIQKSLDDKHIFLWYSTGNVCGYYFVLSPLVNKWLSKHPIDIKKEFNIDLDNYRKDIDSEITQYFNLEFSHEKQ